MDFWKDGAVQMTGGVQIHQIRAILPLAIILKVM